LALKKLYLNGVFMLLLCAAFAGLSGTLSVAQERGGYESGASRLLQGQVLNRNDKPVPDAIVYLKNTRTLVVKTYIAGQDGGYRFPALSPNVDYQIYAEHAGKRSGVKTLSAFDGRREARINLKIDE
jgi:hypothetical protein